MKPSWDDMNEFERIACVGATWNGRYTPDTETSKKMCMWLDRVLIEFPDAEYPLKAKWDYEWSKRA